MARGNLLISEKKAEKSFRDFPSKLKYTWFFSISIDASGDKIHLENFLFCRLALSTNATAYSDNFGAKIPFFFQNFEVNVVYLDTFATFNKILPNFQKLLCIIIRVNTKNTCLHSLIYLSFRLVDARNRRINLTAPHRWSSAPRKNKNAELLNTPIFWPSAEACEFPATHESDNKRYLCRMMFYMDIMTSSFWRIRFLPVLPLIRLKNINTRHEIQQTFYFKLY